MAFILHVTFLAVFSFMLNIAHIYAISTTNFTQHTQKIYQLTLRAIDVYRPLSTAVSMSCNRCSKKSL